MQTDWKNAEVVNDDILFGMSAVKHNPRAAGIESDIEILVLLLITWAQT